MIDKIKKLLNMFRHRYWDGGESGWYKLVFYIDGSGRIIGGTSSIYTFKTVEELIQHLEEK